MPSRHPDQITEAVRERYAKAASTLAASSACCAPTRNRLGADLYAREERFGLPEDAVAASLGCANPVALADLRRGDTVLDLGSGGGIDVLLSARRVGPEGFVYGLDMTDEMLALAQRNRLKAGAENVRFLKGQIEQIPLPDTSVDVVISNCVINLSGDKDRVLAEAYRVLRPGGRFAVADIATLGPIPEAIRRSFDAWAGCIAGALTTDEYVTKLRTAGFSDAAIDLLRTYGRADLDLLSSCALGAPEIEQFSAADLEAAEGKVASVYARAERTMPAARRQS